MNGAVYIDFDDVLCETAKVLSDIVADRFGRRTHFEDIYSFDLNDSFGLNASEQNVIFDLFHDSALLAGLPPVEGSVEGVRQWIESGCEVHVITGRPPETQDASLEWLQAYGLNVAGLTFVDKYARGHSALPGAQQMTLEELLSVEFALIVDDSPDMVRYFAERTLVPVALFDRPWNRRMITEQMRDGVVRCQGWDELSTRFPCPGRGIGQE